MQAFLYVEGLSVFLFVEDSRISNLMAGLCVIYFVVSLQCIHFHRAVEPAVAYDSICYFLYAALGDWSDDALLSFGVALDDW